jgi:ubiquinone/menaquinone biosynthesis C-methylase UbiE
VNTRLGKSMVEYMRFDISKSFRLRCFYSESMKKQVLYGELARYYDLIYSFKDYRKEAVRVRALISKYGKSEGNQLLDVACGTGHHLNYLKDTFSCTGVDISGDILDVARKNVKGVVFEQADMTMLHLGREFDAITCLFSSIGYVKTYSNLRKTIRSFAEHLKKGGVLLIEPWFTKSAYVSGSPHMTTYDGKDVKIARLNISKSRGNVSVIDMHYLVAEKDRDVKYFADRHELRLFEVDETLKIMRSAGLRSRFLKRGLMQGRGMFVGTRDSAKAGSCGRETSETDTMLESAGSL